MKKILIVDDEQPIRDLLQLLVESEFDNEIILAESGQVAQEILSKDREIGIILSDYNMPNGNGGELYIYNSENEKLPFVLVTGGFLEDYPEMVGFLEGKEYFRNIVPKPFEEEFLFDQVRKGLAESGENTDKSTEESGDSEYVRVDIDIFLRQLRGYNFDLFLKLKDEKVIKIFTSNDDIEDEDLLKYKKKNQNEIFLKSVDFNQVKTEMMKTIFEQLKKASSVKEAFDAAGNAMSFMMAGSKLLSIDPEQVKLVESSVESCLRNLEQEKGLKEFLKSFNIDEGYLIAHSMTTLHLCYMVMKEGRFYSQENMERLSYASLMHDCEHSCSESCIVLDQESEKFSVLGVKEQESVLNHSLWAADLVSGIKSIPEDVETIIRFHHEKPDGSGFPRGVNQNSFTVLSACFVLCLRIADHLFYNDNSQERLLTFIDSLEEHFSKGPFKSSWEAVKKIIT